MPTLSDYVVFNDRDLERRFSGGRIPMAELYEAYFDGDIDIVGDIYDFLERRHDLVSWSITGHHLRWVVKNFIPEVVVHTKAQDRRIVREHYDRGNDFFGWFLGERMVYTSGFFDDPEQTVEQGQDNKIDLVCQKLQLRPGEKLLDIGCGWGTLARHAAKHYGVDATGITISKNQTEYGNRRIQEDGVSDRARILCLDYRDIPRQKFDKIVSLEMVEHVGVKNLVSFYKLVNSLLVDEGLFLLQWTGLRRGLDKESLIWGLFMSKYVFPGADASLCPAPMLKAMEKGGWETHSVENVSQHYCWTIRKWHDNWMSNRADIVAAYGERWYRIWHFFLAWSVIIARQGNAACFQVVLNKNIDEYDRTRWVKNRAVILGDRSQRIATGARPTNGDGARAAE